MTYTQPTKVQKRRNSRIEQQRLHVILTLIVNSTSFTIYIDFLRTLVITGVFILASYSCL